MATKKERQSSTSQYLDDLRQQAEKIDWERIRKTPAFHETEIKSPDVMWELVRELRIHQIELEIQNEELRRIQEEIEISQARYFDLYNLAPVGYLSLSEKGVILEGNLTFAKLVGLEAGKLRKERLTRFIHFNDQDIYYLWRKKLFEARMPQACELRLINKESTALWVRLEANLAHDSDDGVVIRITVSDIHNRKLIENGLLETGIRSLAILKQASEAIIVYDSSDGRIIEINDSSVQMFGYSEEELLLMTIYDAPFLSDEQSASIVEQLNRQGQIFPSLGQYKHKNDGLFFAEQLVSPIHYADFKLGFVSFRNRRDESETSQNQRTTD
ncbi:MAG TPA: PAS domain-containing protein [Patescibacteria group bacterium]|nr:PAS domain-containing protein [Patescibacteria group bacterium]